MKAAVKAAVQAAGAELRTFWGATLAHREDLPFPLEQLPQKFGALGAARLSVVPVLGCAASLWLRASGAACMQPCPAP